MIKYIFLVCLTSVAAAVSLEQVLIEEPSQTNRSAAAWLDSKSPINTDAATLDYVRRLTATSSYDSAMQQVSSILSSYTDRFSTDWSYRFRDGGGLSVHTLIVRDKLDVRVPLSVGPFDTQFLSATNGVRLGSVTAQSAAIRGPSLSVGDVPVLTAGAVTSGVTVVSRLSSPTGVVTFDAPAVFLNKPPLFASSVGQSTNDPPAALFYSAGVLRVGEYVDGLLGFQTTVVGPFRLNTVQDYGLDAVGATVTYDMGAMRQQAGWGNIPVVSTLHTTSDPAFTHGFWEFSYEDSVEAYLNLTNAVEAMFVYATNTVEAAEETGGAVAGYETPDTLLEESPGFDVGLRVYDWQTNLTSSLTGLVAAAEAYSEASRVLINEAASDGVVNTVFGHSGGTAYYTKRRQMRPMAGVVSRVSVQLSLPQGYEFTGTPAKYTLYMNKYPLLVHSVSSSGETGPAFAFLQANATPGYLYLDLSEVKSVHGLNVLKAVSYFVKVEVLRGQTPWQSPQQ